MKAFRAVFLLVRLCLKTCLIKVDSFLIVKLEKSYLEAGHPPEVGHAGDGVGQLLDLVEVVQHAGRAVHVPHGGGLSSPAAGD